MKMRQHQRKELVCSMKDNTTKLLGLEDVIVKNVYENEDGCNIEIEQPRRKHFCPCCGNETDKIHDYRLQKVKDLDVRRVHTYLLLRKRRYVCRSCNKRFYEKNNFLPCYYRVTNRLVAKIINGKYIVMDMNPQFRDAAQICFPNAKIVIDRYHVSRQAIWALENVRKAEQKALSASWRKYCKHSKSLLCKSKNKLKADELQRLRIILGIKKQDTSLCFSHLRKESV